jgi:hypothetical protein
VTPPEAAAARVFEVEGSDDAVGEVVVRAGRVVHRAGRDLVAADRVEGDQGTWVAPGQVTGTAARGDAGCLRSEVDRPSSPKRGRSNEVIVAVIGGAPIRTRYTQVFLIIVCTSVIEHEKRAAASADRLGPRASGTAEGDTQ